jgi:DNA repair protein RadA/Sms
VPCGMPEVDRVLGGGFVEGSVVLLGGEPGVGKSTLLLQVVATLATRARTGSAKGGVLYVSGEESAAQVAGRAKRLGVRDGDALHLLASGVLEDVEAAIAQTDASVIAIDSVQTMRAGDLESAAGSVGQLREVTSRLVTLAKQQGRTVVLVGHVTKDGSLAGPKVLEHLVDVVVAFEGSRSGGPRILRAVKNRFGPAGEIAVLEMTRDGLQEVADPSSLFLAERPKDVPGSVVAASADGIRPMLVEVQALVTPSAMPSPRRVATGVDATRLAILVAVLGQRAGLSVRDRDVFVSVAGGASVDEPAVDLAVACAIASSVVELSLPADLVVFGEIGLAGEVRAVPRCTPRLEEALKLGFKRALVPRANVERGGGSAGGSGPWGGACAGDRRLDRAQARGALRPRNPTRAPVLDVRPAVADGPEAWYLSTHGGQAPGCGAREPLVSHDAGRAGAHGAGAAGAEGQGH